jgi:uncharacterized membrane protein
MYQDDMNAMLFFGGGGVVAIIVFVMGIIKLINYIRKLLQEIKENKNKNKNRSILGIILLIFIVLISGLIYGGYMLYNENNKQPVSIPFSNINL